MSKTLKLEMVEKVQFLALTSPDRTISTAEPSWQGAKEQRPGYHLHTPKPPAVTTGAMLERLSQERPSKLSNTTDGHRRGRHEAKRWIHNMDSQ